ncbi:MAG: hypothetical protein JOZ69_19565 [Myxococcales bacterium]|nr:hypothetical protein [Myxococcales bacterium]
MRGAPFAPTVLAGLTALFTLAAPLPSRAQDEPSALFSAGAKALREGRPVDAIASLEALADRGVVDAAASYDRGLAYAMRVRIGAEMPGDLGRAAHGFEEARDLARDSGLAADAAGALGAIRSEVARRRMRAGQPMEVDPGRSLARTVAGLLGENGWCAIAALASAALGIGFFVRWLAGGRRLKVAGGMAAGVAFPVLAVAVLMTLGARHDRANLREAVVVSPSARPSDERGFAAAGGVPLPEGARVEVLGTSGSVSRIRFGAVQTWVASNALRPIEVR